MREKLIKILRDKIPAYREDQPLAGQIDSLGLIALVDEFEREFRIRFRAMDLVPNVFADAAAIETLIQRKLEER